MKEYCTGKGGMQPNQFSDTPPVYDRALKPMKMPYSLVDIYHWNLTFVWLHFGVMIISQTMFVSICILSLANIAIRETC